MDFCIEKAKVSIPDAGKKTYTGAYLESDLTNTSLYAVQNNGGKSVGEYEIVLALKDPRNYVWETGEELYTTVIFEIINGENKIFDVMIANWTYGEVPSTPTASAMYGEVQFAYYTDGEKPLDEIPVNAGSYKLRAYVLGDGVNYGTVYSDYVEFRIEKAKVSIPDAGKKTYTGAYLESDLQNTDIYTVEKKGGITVGTYDTVLTLIFPQNYEWQDHDAVSVTLRFQIISTENRIEDLTIPDWTYGETPSAPSARSEFGEVFYEFFDENFEKIKEIPIEAGTYHVRAFVVSDGTNFETVYSDFVTFHIYPKTVNAPERLESKAYTGKLLKSDVWDTDIYHVTRNDGGVDIGKYDVVLTLNDSKNYRWSTTEEASIVVQFEIVKVVNTISDVIISNWTYGETPSVPFAASKIGDVHFRYFDANGKALTTPPCDAGEYRVKAYVSADGDNYEAVESQNFTYFTIYKKAVDVPREAGSVEYNGMYQACELEETEFYTVSAAGGVDVDIYHVTLSLKDPRNYYWSTGDKTADKTLYFHIEKNNKNSIGSFYVKDSLYGEKRETPKAFSVFGEVRFTYSDRIHGDFTSTVPKKAGVWYVKASVANTKNYNGCEVIRSFEIKKAYVDIPDNAGYKIYNGQRQKSDLSDTEFYTVGINRGGINVGDYEVILRLRDTENTMWSDGTTEEKTLIFSILETKNVISNVVIEDFTYGGTFVYPYATALFGEVNYEYYDEYGNLLERFPVNAGIYRARAYVINGNGQKEYSEGFTTFVIHKATVPIPSADMTEYVYSGEMHRYFIEKSDLYTVIGDRRTRVGTQKVTVMLNDKENYVWENGSAEDIFFNFTVKDASISDRIDLATEGEGFTSAELLFLGVSACGAAGIAFAVFYRRFIKKHFTKRRK